MTAGTTARVCTDTATLCVFDPALLRHKLDDDCDWWSIPGAELAAVNAGQVAFFNVSGDGAYDLVVHAELAEPHVSVHLAVVSGRVFIGAGEDVTGGGLEPDTAFGGLFVDVPVGGCRVQARRDGDLISLAFVPDARSSNAFGDLVRI
ncbi:MULTISPECIES: DUF6386 family protein [unclassified Janthinobacterium]|uniref:DUF6386 family protein n=1 Tax=unclassified Janthinobacterium TaxID=2610881 RepID=UPI000CB7D45F|nr:MULTISPECIES: DUF6386 family protein [unclassified Janthinobacterium]PKV43879.1 hypothetical protein CLU92_1200 [Janthinobacterium sp. 61]TDY35893.1 hypothetical protein C8C89_3768 [Janthinobacterium sp. 75]